MRSFLIFLFILYSQFTKAEDFYKLYANQLNFENYPIVSVICLVQIEYRDKPDDPHEYYYKIIENGTDTEILSQEILEVIDNYHIIVELKYNSLSPMYVSRDIIFEATSSKNENYKGESLVFLNTGDVFIPPQDEIDETFVLFGNQVLDSFQIENNQIPYKPEASWLADYYLTGCTAEELHLMWNEYYARKGFLFEDTKLLKHFTSQDWYTPRTSSSSIDFSEEEASEIAYLKYYENLKLNTVQPSEIIFHENGNTAKEVYVYKTKEHHRPSMKSIWYDEKGETQKLIINFPFNEQSDVKEFSKFRQKDLIKSDRTTENVIKYVYLPKDNSRRIQIDSIVKNERGHFNFDEMKKMYELIYPQSQDISLSIGNLIKLEKSGYLHSIFIDNNSENDIFLGKHMLYLKYISETNEIYKHPLYTIDSTYIKAGESTAYDDNFVQEINGQYMINNWVSDKSMTNLFPDEMNYGKYLVILVLEEEVSKRLIYSNKAVLEYIPIQMEEE